jgi:hypothetical protein
MNSFQLLNPITFSDALIEAVRKDMPEVLNEKIGYKYGRSAEKSDKSPSLMITCMPYGESKIINFGDNFIHEEVSYLFAVESRESLGDEREGIRKAIEVAWFIRLMWLDTHSHVRTFLRNEVQQTGTLSGINMISAEGLFKNAVGFSVTLQQHMTWLGEDPPVTTVIKSLYRMDTEEYIEGETITAEDNDE